MTPVTLLVVLYSASLLQHGRDGAQLHQCPERDNGENPLHIYLLLQDGRHQVRHELDLPGDPQRHRGYGTASALVLSLGFALIGLIEAPLSSLLSSSS